MAAGTDRPQPASPVLPPRVPRTYAEAKMEKDSAAGTARAEALEDRVAALEAALTFACTSPPPRPLTEAEMAGFRRQFDEAVQGKPFKYQILPSAPPLTPDEIRQLLRECVTVVKPGETLIVRVPVTWAMDQVSNYQKNFSDWARWLDLPFKVIVVIGEELGVAEPGGVPGAA